MQRNFLGLSAASGCLNQPMFQRPTFFVIRVSPRRFHCTLSLCYSLNVSDQVSHPCKTTLTVNGQNVNFCETWGGEGAVCESYSSGM